MLFKVCGPGLSKSGTGFDLSSKKPKLAELEKKMGQANFWDNQDKARAVVSELKSLKGVIEPVDAALAKSRDAQVLLELAREENDADRLAEVDSELAVIRVKLQRIE